MKTVFLATSSQRKIAEATETLKPFGVEIRPVSVHVEEIQHSDPREIARAKARTAFALLEQPVVVQDTSWSIPALGGFPGGYMKDVSTWLSTDNWLNAMRGHTDREFLYKEHVAFCSDQQQKDFLQTYKGEIINEPRGRGCLDMASFACIATFGESGKTLAELDDGCGYASVGTGHWRQFGEWFADNM